MENSLFSFGNVSFTLNVNGLINQLTQKGITKALNEEIWTYSNGPGAS